MKNNSIGIIRTANARRASTPKNKSGALHTTLDFGSVRPGKVQRITANSSFDLSTGQKVILSPIVRPVLGKLALRSLHYFVPMSDLTENFAPMVAQQPVSRGTSTFTPHKLPNVPYNELCLMCLFGAHMTIYKSNGSIGDDYKDLYQLPAASLFNAELNSLPQDMQDCIQDLGISGSYSSFGLSNAMGIYPSVLGSSNYFVRIFLSNPNYASFFDCRTQHPDLDEDGADYVSLDGYDAVIETAIEVSSGVYHNYTLAFRFSSFGRRLADVINAGIGPLNFDIRKPVSVLPLFAIFMSWYNSFAPQLYNNWQQSLAYDFLRKSDQLADPSFSVFGSSTLSSSFRSFVLTELGFMFVTDEQDFVSAHIRSTAVAPSQQGLINSIVTDVDENASVPGRPNIDVSSAVFGEPPDLSSPNGHAMISDTIHGQLDSELLMRLYRQTNIFTVAGRRIAELLRAQGFGDFVDNVKSNFIGQDDTEIEIYDIPSMSDTYQKASDTGMKLGEYGARGQALGHSGNMHYETSEDGYYVNLLCVVPIGGYAEAADPDAFCLDKFSQYNQEFDSLGYEYSMKAFVQAAQPWSNMNAGASFTEGKLDDSFGLVPRDFKRKFGRNVLAGGFAMHSTRASYLPFCLEKVIDVGEHVVDAPYVPTGSSNVYRFVTHNVFQAKDMPIAGDVWRYPTRYDWIGRFNRIFYNDKASFDRGASGVQFLTANFEYFGLREDNFIVHVLYNLVVRDQMLPVADSFETSDDDNKSNGSMSKA